MRHALLIGLSMLLVTGCDKSSDKGEPPPTASKDDAEQAKTAKTKKKKRERTKKDRGDASVQIGGTPWQADRAKAKLKNDLLTISASHTEIVDKKASRQQLTLVVPDYKGPGTYQARPAGSMFIGVGLDTDAMKKADTEEKQTKEVVNTMSKAKTIMLMKTTVIVESDDGTQIVGAFSQPALSTRYPALTAGKFRALIKK